MAQPLIEAAGELLPTEVEEHLGRGREEHAVAGLNGGERDVLGDHRLAEALVRDEHDVVTFLEEVEAERPLDGVPVDLLGALSFDAGALSPVRAASAARSAIDCRLR